MKNKQKKEKRYILVEFDGTTTKAYTFRTKPVNVANFKCLNCYKGFRSAEAKLHPDDVYDQNTGLRLALERIGFDINPNPFMPILKALRIVSDVFGDKDDE